ncbi:MAG TPA: hypothetical protein VGR90_04075 [Acidimicrobiales bacterium]|nr:hypothetical protein [Acidimicrobiales bacterium]
MGRVLQPEPLGGRIGVQGLDGIELGRSGGLGRSVLGLLMEEPPEVVRRHGQQAEASRHRGILGTGL